MRTAVIHQCWWVLLRRRRGCIHQRIGHWLDTPFHMSNQADCRRKLPWQLHSSSESDWNDHNILTLVKLVFIYHCMVILYMILLLYSLSKKSTLLIAWPYNMFKRKCYFGWDVADKTFDVQLSGARLLTGRIGAFQTARSFS